MDVGYTWLTRLVTDLRGIRSRASYTSYEVLIVFGDVARDTSYFDFNVGTVKRHTSDVDFLATSCVSFVIVDRLDSWMHSHNPAIITCEVTMRHPSHLLSQPIPKQDSRIRRVLTRPIRHNHFQSVMCPAIKPIRIFKQVLSIHMILTNMD